VPTNDSVLGYAGVRRPDPRIEARIRSALGSNGPIINVGAGAGSYEPSDLPVVAVEPASSSCWRNVRPVPLRPSELSPRRCRSPTYTFAAGMAVLTVHHWRDLSLGLKELSRVVQGPIAVLSWDREIFNRYWMVAEYVPASRTLDLDLPAA
jgi:hypothetical protein